MPSRALVQHIHEPTPHHSHLLRSTSGFHRQPLPGNGGISPSTYQNGEAPSPAGDVSRRSGSVPPPHTHMLSNGTSPVHLSPISTVNGSYQRSRHSSNSENTNRTNQQEMVKDMSWSHMHAASSSKRLTKLTNTFGGRRARSSNTVCTSNPSGFLLMSNYDQTDTLTGDVLPKSFSKHSRESSFGNSSSILSSHGNNAKSLSALNDGLEHDKHDAGSWRTSFGSNNSLEVQTKADEDQLPNSITDTNTAYEKHRLSPSSSENDCTMDYSASQLPTPNVKSTKNLLPVDAESLQLPRLLHSTPNVSSTDRECSGASTPTPSQDTNDLTVSLSLCGLAAGIDEAEMANRFSRKRVTFDDLCQRPQLIDDSNLVVRINNRYLAWKVAAPAIMSQLVFHRSLPSHTVDALVDKHHPRVRSWFFWSRSSASKKSSKVVQQETAEAPLIVETRSETEDDEQSVVESLDGEKALSADELPRTHNRSLYLTSDQLKLLQLRYGVNECEFSVASKFQGRAKVTCNIFLWKHDTRIIVSDIDGTITKSDVLGHAAALVGTDWTQRGVASLYSKISNNGYKFVYLSSRSISQATATKEYITSILQGSQTLPDGPILLSPASLFRSFHREVILRRPEEFKIACLSGVKRVFGSHSDNPLAAGFGNRHTDVVTYRAVGIPDAKIFIVDPKGILRVSKGAYESSYEKLSELVDQIFPPLDSQKSDERFPEFNTFNFWRIPPLPLSATEEDILKL